MDFYLKNAKDKNMSLHQPKYISYESFTIRPVHLEIENNFMSWEQKLKVLLSFTHRHVVPRRYMWLLFSIQWSWTDEA